MRYRVFFIGLIAVVVSSGFAEIPFDTTKGIALSGQGWLQEGQLVKYHFREREDVGRAWLSEARLRISADKTITPWLKTAVGLEILGWYETYDLETNSTFLVPDRFFSYSIRQGEALFSWGELLSLELGIFPFKYNPEVRNLGEYVFRSGVYPGFLIGEFDIPEAVLTGLRINNRIAGKFTEDLLLTLEEQFKPFHDITLSYLAAYTPHPAITIGLGASASHLISVDEKRTTPKTDGTWYIEDPDTLRDTSGADSAILGDTAYLTFRGVKIMGRLCFDIKQLFPHSIFGPEDLKLYGEAAILGLQNYDLYYDTLWQRIPVMMGFNFPTFKILDVLSLEAEWYGSPYPNNYKNAFSIQPLPRPIPDDPPRGVPPSVYRKDDWKWSVYAKKTIAGSFSVSAQCARDHVRIRANNPNYIEREEVLTKDNQWYWMLKFAYGF
jgi:hypothetical protein